jgi:hypothetical protein
VGARRKSLPSTRRARSAGTANSLPEAADRVPAVTSISSQLIARKPQASAMSALWYAGRQPEQPWHQPQCCGCGLEDLEQLRIGRIAVREEVEAEPTGTSEGQVRGVPPDRVTHVRDDLPNVLGQVAGLDSPIVLDEWLECTAVGGGGREQVLWLHEASFSAVAAAGRFGTDSTLSTACLYATSSALSASPIGFESRYRPRSR